MSDYAAPLKDMQFVLEEIAPLDQLASVPAYQDVNFCVADYGLEDDLFTAVPELVAAL